jgi:NADH:ubiquinone oxidoreductase subunit F (NADH-binding)
MKTTIKILAFICATAFYASCKKCTTCEVKDGSGNVVYPAEETCGNASQIEEAKDLNNTKAIIISGTSTCVDN